MIAQRLDKYLPRRRRRVIEGSPKQQDIPNQPLLRIEDHQVHLFLLFVTHFLHIKSGDRLRRRKRRRF